MSLEGGQYPDNTCCDSALRALRAIGEIQQDEVAPCDECPFPFCIRSEARAISNMANVYLADGMAKLGYTVQAIAKQLGVTTRAVYNYSLPEGGCHWCGVDTASSSVFCRTSTSTVAFDEDEVVVVLSSHRCASELEGKLVGTLVEGMFPHGWLSAGNGDIHEHWKVENISIEEAKKVYEDMDFLSQFTMKLR